MFAAKRERLTWRTAREQVNFTTNLVKVEFPNVSLMQRPPGYRGDFAPLVFADRVAAITIPLDDDVVEKTSRTRAKGETTSASE